MGYRTTRGQIKAKLKPKAAIPSGWAMLVVKYGSQDKHLYHDSDYSPALFATEAEAQQAAEIYCLQNTEMIVAILRVERLVKTKPGFEIVAA